ncbi:uncharacterized protein LOC130752951 [Actinidia eriantha]|uniref:uncharacterized protein LOC130752951 n=1 Tax=Actinidia eriantha TaxID=165200 RepID=UPI002590A83D|nr:uncharacterized protein LOC130752951 [Actinidia eriantha]
MTSLQPPNPKSTPLSLQIHNRTVMENKHSAEEDVSSAQAVLLGALAPGVNGPTWNTLKFAFLMLGLCLAAMLGLAFSSSDSWLILHVTLLVLITGTLFLLLSSFLAQTGLVSVEHQMQEMGLVPKDLGVINKKSS